MIRRISLLLTFVLLAWTSGAMAREWTDSTGKYKQMADLVDFDEHTVVLKKADGRLVAVPLEKISKADQEYLKSKDATQVIEKEASSDRTWTLDDGKTVSGKVLDYGRAHLVVERKGGKLVVNDKPFDKMTKLHQYMVPKVVSHFEQGKYKDMKDLQKLVAQRPGEPLTYDLEGVMLQLDDGEKFAVPFFAFSEKDQRILKPGWKEWEAADDDKQKKQHAALKIRSLANAYQRDRNMSEQIQMLQFASQWFDLWQVALQVNGEFTTVVVPARNSEQAAVAALNQYPGAVVGAIAKLERRTGGY